ncbi:MAG: serine hydrolase [Deltaproteobacteria bacterium]|nr:serine hydrolase [Deltaproteobacteria bacterium]
MSSESQFLSKLDAWRSQDGGTWSEATPSFQIQVFEKGKLQIDLAFGDRYRFYDWASLTKMVFSTTSAMMAIEDGELKLSDTLADWIPELGPAPIFQTLRVKHLLTHSAGMTWWKPFFKMLDRARLADHESAWSKLFSEVVKDAKKSASSGNLEMASQGRAIYSDLDFFLLGEVLRRATLAGFPRRWSTIAERLELFETCFHVERKSQIVLPYGARLGSLLKKQTAPTEIDLRRGKKPLQGYVHDENTSALHGVAPHAGLFGPIHDLSLYGLELRKLALGKKSKLPRSGISFLRRSMKREKGDWATGFMMPTKGSASCGSRFDLSSIGHTGFTGTSMWFDPKNDRLISILSNRICPSRKNTRFLELRPALHTMAVDSL